MLLLALFLAVVQRFLPADAIVGGEPVQWNRYGFLSKVFSRESGSSVVTSCTGAIISGSLVLTSAQCLLNSTTDSRLTEFVVTVATIKKPRTLPAEIAEMGDTWGLLRIPDITSDSLCPPDPAPKRVAQLNLKLSLLQSSVVPVDPISLKKKCWLVGFATSDNATDFIKQDDVRLLELDSVDPVKGRNNYYASVIKGNETTCWDDAGAALFCTTKRQGPVLVGIFQHLITNGKSDKGKDSIDLENLNLVDSCERAVEMRFSKTVDQNKIIEAIQKHDLSSFVHIYDNCFKENM